jgi:hypothetical protein
LLRIADLAPLAALSQVADDAPPAFLIPTGMIGLIAMISTERMQRLGDLAAGTMVIVDQRSWRLPVAKVDDPRVPALASFVPGDYRVSRSMARTLAIYAERRHYLTPARRREVARHLTIPLVERFEFRRDIDPDLLLYALYYTTFLADSSAELPDLGPLAGYSPLLRDAHKPQGLVGDSPASTVGSAVSTAPRGNLAAAGWPSGSKPRSEAAGGIEINVQASAGASPSDDRNVADPPPANPSPPDFGGGEPSIEPPEPSIEPPPVEAPPSNPKASPEGPA